MLHPTFLARKKMGGESGLPYIYSGQRGFKGGRKDKAEGERGRKAVRREFELLISYNYRNIAMSSGSPQAYPPLLSFLPVHPGPPSPPLAPFSVILAIVPRNLVLRFPSTPVPPFSEPHLRAISRKTANLPSQFKLICGGRGVGIKIRCSLFWNFPTC